MKRAIKVVKTRIEIYAGVFSGLGWEFFLKQTNAHKKGQREGDGEREVGGEDWGSNRPGWDNFGKVYLWNGIF